MRCFSMSQLLSSIKPLGTVDARMWYAELRYAVIVAEVRDPVANAFETSWRVITDSLRKTSRRC